MHKETKTCCFCGKELVTFEQENNPYPACKDEDARCCSECNDLIVIPARELLANTSRAAGEKTYFPSISHVSFVRVVLPEELWEYQRQPFRYFPILKCSTCLVPENEFLTAAFDGNDMSITFDTFEEWKVKYGERQC